LKTPRAIAILATACLLLGAVPAAPAPLITTTVLGTVPGYDWTVPAAINNKGEVAGYAGRTWPRTGYAAFVWTPKQGFRVIAEDAYATDINDRGDVTGYVLRCRVGHCELAGFVWNARGGFTDLGQWQPRAINNNGDIAGDCSNDVGTDAVCVIRNGVRTRFVCNGCAYRAADINERGDVVGYSARDYDGTWVVLFPRDGSAPVVLTECCWSEALGINNAGTIVGSQIDEATQLTKMTAWTRRGIEQIAGAGPAVVGWAVNSRGWVVGTEYVGSSVDSLPVAVIWAGGGSPLVHLAPGSPPSYAVDINEQGMVLGTVDGQVVIWRVRL
jgi:uncharacterized membrane protein